MDLNTTLFKYAAPYFLTATFFLLCFTPFTTLHGNPNATTVTIAEIDVIYEICLGDTLRLNSISREITCNCPPNPPAPCDNFPFLRWSEWTADPSLVVLDDPSFVLVSPEETTIYTTTLGGFDCGADGPNYPVGPTYTFEVRVNTTSDCAISEPENATTFDFNACTGDTLTLPRPNAGTCDGGEDPEGAGVLFDIIDATDHTFQVVLIENGTTSYTTNVVADANQVSCPQATYNYHFIANDCNGGTTIDTTENELPTVFETYPWLLDLVNPTNCLEEKVEVFDFGSYTFLLISTATGQVLYFEDGTLYCTSSPSYNCQLLYGLTEPTITWECSSNMTEEAPNNTEEENGEASTPVTTASIFTDFLWLSELVDTNRCQGEEVSVYSLGVYSFIFIQKAGSGTLYFEDGSLYCRNGIGYDCRSLYGLSAPTATFICPSEPQRISPNTTTKKIKVTQAITPTFNVFPNPNHGQFSIRLDVSEQLPQTLTISDFSGQQIHQLLIPATAIGATHTVNLGDLPKGVYLATRASTLSLEVRRVVVQ